LEITETGFYRSHALSLTQSCQSTKGNSQHSPASLFLCLPPEGDGMAPFIHSLNQNYILHFLLFLIILFSVVFIITKIISGLHQEYVAPFTASSHLQSGWLWSMVSADCVSQWNTKTQGHLWLSRDRQ